MKTTGSLAVVISLAVVLPASVGLSCADEGGSGPASAEVVSTTAPSTAGASTIRGDAQALPLPAPDTEGSMSLEEAIRDRRSVRDYADEPLTLDELGQLLWSAQGMTSDRGARAAPSAGGTYPLELYIAVGRVIGLGPGVYHYRPEGHSLEIVSTGDARARLMEASLDQSCVGDAAVDIIVAAVYERTTGTYGERGIRYVHLEAGHAAQNLSLQAVALGLATVPVGAFSDERVQAVVGLAADEQPLYVIPIGRPAAD